MRYRTLSLALLLSGCSAITARDAGPDAPRADVALPDALPDAASVDAPLDAAPADVCAVPPPVVSGPAGSWCEVGEAAPEFAVPEGFCVRRFAAELPSSQGPRLDPHGLAFTREGGLLVASPSQGSPEGSTGGHSAVLLLLDEDRDGRADAVREFATGPELATVHGLALGGDTLYFTTEHRLWSTALAPNQRAEDRAQRVDLGVSLGAMSSAAYWAHGLARSTNGRLFLSRGVLAAVCTDGEMGAVLELQSPGALVPVAAGLHRPQALRCHYRDEVCLAAELAQDAKWEVGGLDQLLAIGGALQQFGYPRCYSVGHPARCGSAADCGADRMTDGLFSFPGGATPFGFDWERERWPAAYRGAIFAALRGDYYLEGLGAGLVWIPTDAATHLPLPGSPRPFLSGPPERCGLRWLPSDLVFAPDGRLFFASDVGNAIYWVAPLSLPRAP